MGVVVPLVYFVVVLVVVVPLVYFVVVLIVVVVVDVVQLYEISNPNLVTKESEINFIAAQFPEDV